MKSVICILAAPAVSLMLAGTAAAQQASVSDGGEVYARTCGRCHNARPPVERTDGEWTVIVAHMRVRGNLTGREERAVRAFLQAMNRPAVDQSERGEQAVAAAPVSLPDTIDQVLADSGRALTQRYGCAACHQLGVATSGTLGPNLNTVLTRRTPDYILEKLANPRFDNANSLMAQLPLSPDDRRAILEYLRTLKN
ncbi:MAG TPA: cytochrome c [bacterium]